MDPFRFLVPASTAVDAAHLRALEAFLSKHLAGPVEVAVARSYTELARDALGGFVHGAWAPPMVCARAEMLGLPILARTVRADSSRYRAALIARHDADFDEDHLWGKAAAWVDRGSTAGYLLPQAHFRDAGRDLSRELRHQFFVGSYRKALEAVVSGDADLTSIFASVVGQETPAVATTGVVEVWPEALDAFKVLGTTASSPHDGFIVGLRIDPGRQRALREALVRLHESDAGCALLDDVFRAERFETSTSSSYRALYRVAASRP